MQGLLESAGIKDDLILVGHSMAGYNIRAAQRLLTSNRVVGVVLVDPVDTETYDNCKEGETNPPNPLVIIIIHNLLSNFIN